MGRHTVKKISTPARIAVAGAAVAGASTLLAPAASAAPDSDWDRLAQCESGGNWHLNTGNGYYGGLQFASATWNGFGGNEFAPFAHQASREQQIVVAERVLASQGWGAWPACSQKLGLNSSATQRTAPGTAKKTPAPVSNDEAEQALSNAKTLPELANVFNSIVDQLTNAGLPVPAQLTELFKSLSAQLQVNQLSQVANQALAGLKF